MKTRCLWFLIAIIALAVPASGGTRIMMNDGWNFKIDAASEGEKSGWPSQMPAGVENVRIPNTWNIGVNDDYEGIAWYFLNFDAPPMTSGSHVELHFGATFYKARVWLNGAELGSHEGGYTEYFFDITPAMKRTNYLAVEIDNRPGVATIPGLAMRLLVTKNIWYDWWHYGGIVRNVWLTVNQGALVRRQQIRTRVEGQAAEVQNSLHVENLSRAPIKAHLRVTVYSPVGSQTAATQERQLSLAPGKSVADFKIQIASPQLWGIDHPFLYRMQTELLDSKGRLLDEQSGTFGIRTIEIRDRHLLVNGERVRLSGMTRHEDSPSEGLAETQGSILHDYNEMKDLQVTLTRPVHYPQNPLVLDFADKNGILLVPEIPVWQFSEAQLSDPKVIALAKQQMREMIEQAGNHPSIFAWSVCNESETFTPGGRAYFKLMKEMIREIDPDRFVTFADDHLLDLKAPEESASSDADFIMMNQYFGSWAGPACDLPKALDKVDSFFPQKMVIISEFGVAGVFARNSVEADRKRIEIIRSQLQEFRKRDWIGGAIFWCYQDYKSHRNLWPGYTEGYVDHGLVDRNWQRRPSFFVWEAENAPAVIEADWNSGPYSQPDAFSGQVKRRPEDFLPSYPLHDYCLEWEVRDQYNTLLGSGKTTFADLDQPQAISGKWKLKGDEHNLYLRIRLVRPTGFIAAEKNLNWHLVAPGGQNIQQMDSTRIDIPE
jgi:beta-glucuronidase